MEIQGKRGSKARSARFECKPSIENSTLIQG